MYNIVDAIYQMVVRPIFFLIKNKKTGLVFVVVVVVPAADKEVSVCVAPAVVVVVFRWGRQKQVFLLILDGRSKEVVFYFKLIELISYNTHNGTWTTRCLFVVVVGAGYTGV
jgi:hypothetical protein